MTKPEVVILLQRVDAPWRQIIWDAVRRLSASCLVINIDEPLELQMRQHTPTGVNHFDAFVYYLRDCRSLIHILGALPLPPSPSGGNDPLLSWVAGVLYERERHGSGVGRILLVDHPSRPVGPLPGTYLTVSRDTAPYIHHLIDSIVNASRQPSFFERPLQEHTYSEDPDAYPSPDTTTVWKQPLGSTYGFEGETNTLDDSERRKTRGSSAAPAPDVVPPAPAPVEGQTKTRVPDEVSCSVYAPRIAAPGDEILVQAFAHLPDQEAEVATAAAAADPAAGKVGGQRLDEPVAEGERLGFHLTMRGTEIDQPDQELVWRGQPLAAQFCVYFPDSSQPRSAVGTVIVTKGGVPIGHIKFTLRVVTRDEKNRADSAAAEMLGGLTRYRHAFISYASKDREKVLPRVQALAAAGIDVFQDFIGLEPGERWKRGLYKHIDESDVFFLFWSAAASESEWVRREAEYARQRQAGKDDSPPEIIPIIIEGPPPPPPPPPLDFLHFNDKYIYLLKGVEAEAEAKRGR